MPEQDFAKAVRTAEGSDYNRVGGLVRDQARLLGAYNIPSDEWEMLAESTGYKGARWQDQRAQDAVAHAVFRDLKSKYVSWDLVAVAWKAGEAMADAVARDPKILDHAKLKTLKAYVQRVMGSLKEDYQAPEIQPEPVVSDQPAPQAETNGALAMRGILTAMRNNTRTRAAKLTEEPDGPDTQ